MGGNAFTDVDPIRHNEFNAVFADIKHFLNKQLNIKKEDIFLLGSGGKKFRNDCYGDIDIGIEMEEPFQSEKFILEILRNNIVAKLLPGGMDNITMKFPTRRVNGFIQVDITLTNNKKYTNWVCHSPWKQESNYKGVHRGIFLAIIAKYANFKIINKRPCGEPAIWSRYVLDKNRGLTTITQTILGKEHGFILKNPRVTHREIETDNVNEIMRLIIGSNFSISDTDSVERLYEVITNKKFINYEKRKNILRSVRKMYNKIGLIYPSYRNNNEQNF